MVLPNGQIPQRTFPVNCRRDVIGLDFRSLTILARFESDLFRSLPAKRRLNSSLDLAINYYTGDPEWAACHDDVPYSQDHSESVCADPSEIGRHRRRTDPTSRRPRRY